MIILAQSALYWINIGHSVFNVVGSMYPELSDYLADTQCLKFLLETNISGIIGEHVTRSG